MEFFAEYDPKNVADHLLVSPLLRILVLRNCRLFVPTELERPCQGRPTVAIAERGRTRPAPVARFRRVAGVGGRARRPRPVVLDRLPVRGHKRGLGGLGLVPAPAQPPTLALVVLERLKRLLQLSELLRQLVLLLQGLLLLGLLAEDARVEPTLLSVVFVVAFDEPDDFSGRVRSKLRQFSGFFESIPFLKFFPASLELGVDAIVVVIVINIEFRFD